MTESVCEVETADDRAITALFAEIRSNLGVHAMITLDKNNIECKPHTCDAHWTPYVIDPFARDCECDGPECDPESCPRFTDYCGECHSQFNGSGWLCLDGGDVACNDCVTLRIDSDGNRF
jgi:hypothetical protein